MTSFDSGQLILFPNDGGQRVPYEPVDNGSDKWIQVGSDETNTVCLSGLKKIAFTIIIDPFGRVTIHNFMKRLQINGKRIPKNVSRPLMNNSTIEVLNYKLSWKYNPKFSKSYSLSPCLKSNQPFERQQFAKRRQTVGCLNSKEDNDDVESTFVIASENEENIPNASKSLVNIPEPDVSPCRLPLKSIDEQQQTSEQLCDLKTSAEHETESQSISNSGTSCDDKITKSTPSKKRTSVIPVRENRATELRRASIIKSLTKNNDYVTPKKYGSATVKGVDAIIRRELNVNNSVSVSSTNTRKTLDNSNLLKLAKTPNKSFTQIIGEMNLFNVITDQMKAIGPRKYLSATRSANASPRRTPKRGFKNTPKRLSLRSEVLELRAHTIKPFENNEQNNAASSSNPTTSASEMENLPISTGTDEDLKSDKMECLLISEDEDEENSDDESSSDSSIESVISVEDDSEYRITISDDESVDAGNISRKSVEPILSTDASGTMTSSSDSSSLPNQSNHEDRADIDELNNSVFLKDDEVSTRILAEMTPPRMNSFPSDFSEESVYSIRSSQSEEVVNTQAEQQSEISEAPTISTPGRSSLIRTRRNSRLCSLEECCSPSNYASPRKTKSAMKVRPSPRSILKTPNPSKTPKKCVRILEPTLHEDENEELKAVAENVSENLNRTFEIENENDNVASSVPVMELSQTDNRPHEKLEFSDPKEKVETDSLQTENNEPLIAQESEKMEASEESSPGAEANLILTMEGQETLSDCEVKDKSFEQGNWAVIGDTQEAQLSLASVTDRTEVHLCSSMNENVFDQSTIVDTPTFDHQENRKISKRHDVHQIDFQELKTITSDLNNDVSDHQDEVEMSKPHEMEQETCEDISIKLMNNTKDSILFDQVSDLINENEVLNASKTDCYQSNVNDSNIHGIRELLETPRCNEVANQTTVEQLLNSTLPSTNDLTTSQPGTQASVESNTNMKTVEKESTNIKTGIENEEFQPIRDTGSIINVQISPKNDILLRHTTRINNTPANDSNGHGIQPLLKTPKHDEEINHELLISTSILTTSESDQHTCVESIDNIESIERTDSLERDIDVITATSEEESINVKQENEEPTEVQSDLINQTTAERHLNSTFPSTTDLNTSQPGTQASVESTAKIQPLETDANVKKKVENEEPHPNCDTGSVSNVQISPKNDFHKFRINDTPSANDSNGHGIQKLLETPKYDKEINQELLISAPILTTSESNPHTCVESVDNTESIERADSRDRDVDVITATSEEELINAKQGNKDPEEIQPDLVDNRACLSIRIDHHQEVREYFKTPRRQEQVNPLATEEFIMTTPGSTIDLKEQLSQQQVNKPTPQQEFNSETTIKIVELTASPEPFAKMQNETQSELITSCIQTLSSMRDPGLQEIFKTPRRLELATLIQEETKSELIIACMQTPSGVSDHERVPPTSTIIAPTNQEESKSKPIIVELQDSPSVSDNANRNEGFFQLDTTNNLIEYLIQKQLSTPKSQNALGVEATQIFEISASPDTPTTKSIEVIQSDVQEVNISKEERVSTPKAHNEFETTANSVEKTQSESIITGLNIESVTEEPDLFNDSIHKNDVQNDVSSPKNDFHQSRIENIPCTNVLNEGTGELLETPKHCNEVLLTDSILHNESNIEFTKNMNIVPIIPANNTKITSAGWNTPSTNDHEIQEFFNTQNHQKKPIRTNEHFDTTKPPQVDIVETTANTCVNVAAAEIGRNIIAAKEQQESITDSSEHEIGEQQLDVGIGSIEEMEIHRCLVTPKTEDITNVENTEALKIIKTTTLPASNKMAEETELITTGPMDPLGTQSSDQISTINKNTSKNLKLAFQYNSRRTLLSTLNNVLGSLGLSVTDDSGRTNLIRGEQQTETNGSTFEKESTIQDYDILPTQSADTVTDSELLKLVADQMPSEPSCNNDSPNVPEESKFESNSENLIPSEDNSDFSTVSGVIKGIQTTRDTKTVNGSDTQESDLRMPSTTSAAPNRRGRKMISSVTDDSTKSSAVESQEVTETVELAEQDLSRATKRTRAKKTKNLKGEVAESQSISVSVDNSESNKSYKIMKTSESQKNTESPESSDVKLQVPSRRGRKNVGKVAGVSKTIEEVQEVQKISSNLSQENSVGSNVIRTESRGGSKIEEIEELQKPSAITSDESSSKVPARRGRQKKATITDDTKAKNLNEMQPGKDAEIMASSEEAHKVQPQKGRKNAAKNVGDLQPMKPEIQEKDFAVEAVTKGESSSSSNVHARTGRKRKVTTSTESEVTKNAIQHQKDTEIMAPSKNFHMVQLRRGRKNVAKDTGDLLSVNREVKEKDSVVEPVTKGESSSSSNVPARTGRKRKVTTSAESEVTNNAIQHQKDTEIMAPSENVHMVQLRRGRKNVAKDTGDLPSVNREVKEKDSVVEPVTKGESSSSSNVPARTGRKRKVTTSDESTVKNYAIQSQKDTEITALGEEVHKAPPRRGRKNVTKDTVDLQVVELEIQEKNSPVSPVKNDESSSSVPARRGQQKKALTTDDSTKSNVALAEKDTKSIPSSEAVAKPRRGRKNEYDDVKVLKVVVPTRKRSKTPVVNEDQLRRGHRNKMTVDSETPNPDTVPKRRRKEPETKSESAELDAAAESTSKRFNTRGAADKHKTETMVSEEAVSAKRRHISHSEESKNSTDLETKSTQKSSGRPKRGVK